MYITEAFSKLVCINYILLQLGLAIDPGRVGSGRKFRSGRFVEKVEGSKKVDFQ